MRVTTWNCYRGKTVDRGLALLAPLRADLVTLQECVRPKGESTSVIWRDTHREDVAAETVSESCEGTSVIWRGSDRDPQAGTAVVSTQAALRLEAINIPNLHSTVVPVRVHAPQPFVFVGVWTHPPYNSVAWEAMSACVDRSDGLPVVAAGDFNSSPGVQGQKTASTEFLKRMQCELGLISTYHHLSGEDYGSETRASYYFQWKESAPFHLDYCFVPEGWKDRLEGVEVGTFEDWPESDHRPLTVDLKD